MSEASLIDSVHEQNTTLLAQLRACKRENNKLFRIISGMCFNEYNDACRHHENTSAACTLRACPLLKGGGK